MEVFDWDSDGGHDLIGGFNTTFGQFFNASASTNFDLVNDKKKAKKGSSYKNSGVLIVQSARIEKRFSFLDFIQGEKFASITSVDWMLRQSLKTTRLRG